MKPVRFMSPTYRLWLASTFTVVAALAVFGIFRPLNSQALDDNLELVVYPSVWTVDSLNSGNNQIAVRGKNGFSGPVTVSVAGLPANILDHNPTQDQFIAGMGGYFCSSHCQASTNNEFPLPIQVNDGQWTSLGPTLIAGDTATLTTTVTITATGGGSTVQRSFTLKIINDNWDFNPEGPPVPPSTFPNPNIFVKPNDPEFASHLYKVNFTAGQSRTVNVDVRNNGDAPQSATLVSNLSGGGITGGISTTYTGGLGQTSVSLAAGQTTTIPVQLSTQAATVNGTYELIFGVLQSDGSTYGTFGISSIISGGASGSSGGSQGGSSPSPSPSPSVTPSTTPSSQATTTIEPSVSPTPSDTVSEEPAVSPETSAPSAPATVAVADSPVEEIELVTDQVIAPASVASAAVTLVTFGTLAGSTGSVVGFLGLWLNVVIALWNLFLETMGLRRRRYPWGTVFDSDTDRPVELTIVRLKDATGKLIETRVTDRFGRYGFLPQVGRYQLEVTKPGYELDHSVVAKGSLYQPVWNLRPLTITAQTHSVHVNVPLTTSKSHLRTPVSLMTFLHRPALLVTLLLTAWNFAVRPNTGSIILLVIALVMLIAEWLLAQPRGYGRVLNLRNQPVKAVSVRLMRAEDNKVVATEQTDTSGSYSFLALPGTYYLALVSNDWQLARDAAAVTVRDQLGSIVAPTLRVVPRTGSKKADRG